MNLWLLLKLQLKALLKTKKNRLKSASKFLSVNIDFSSLLMKSFFLVIPSSHMQWIHCAQHTKINWVQRSQRSSRGIAFGRSRSDSRLLGSVIEVVGRTLREWSLQHRQVCCLNRRRGCRWHEVQGKIKFQRSDCTIFTNPVIPERKVLQPRWRRSQLRGFAAHQSDGP